jgi:hypothetical protein
LVDGEVSTNEVRGGWRDGWWEGRRDARGFGIGNLGTPNKEVDQASMEEVRLSPVWPNDRT